MILYITYIYYYPIWNTPLYIRVSTCIHLSPNQLYQLKMIVNIK